MASDHCANAGRTSAAVSSLTLDEAVRDGAVEIVERAAKVGDGTAAFVVPNPQQQPAVELTRYRDFRTRPTPDLDTTQRCHRCGTQWTREPPP